MKNSRPRRPGQRKRDIPRLGAGHTRRGGGLRRLPDLLSCLLDPAARRRGLAEAKLLTEWPSIVGPALAGRCQPIRLGNGTDRAGGVLVLHVAGSAALELQHSEVQILERINGFFGYPAVSRLRLIQARPRRSSSRPGPRVEHPVSADSELEVREAVQVIRDPALRTALADLGRALKSRPHLDASGGGC
jgi:hypothetical protein